mgnify:CR=1 FL=1
MFDAVNRNTVFDLQTPTSSHFDEGSFAVFVLNGDIQQLIELASCVDLDEIKEKKEAAFIISPDLKTN